MSVSQAKAIAHAARLLSGTRPGGYGAPREWLILPAVAYLLLIFVLPLAMLAVSSFVVEGRCSVQNFVNYLGDAHNRSVVWTTIRYASTVSFLCLALGYPFARVMSAASPRAQALLFAIILIPMSVSIIVRSFGWTVLLRRDGLVNDLLLALGVVDHPIRLLFTEGGLVLGSVGMQLPLMILPIYAVVRSIPPEFGEAGACLGAGPIYRLLRLDLPLAAPGMIAGFSIVFSQTAAAYVIPSLLGGSRFKTMSSTIVDSYLVLHAGALGSTVSVLLLAIISIVIAASGAQTRVWR
jgi:putative spermidine/putrescine transport system permease protein